MYQLSIHLVDDLGVTSATSAVAHARIATAHLTRNWKVVETGDDTLGFHTFRHGCRYFINVIQADDLTGQFTDAWAKPRFGLVEIGQDHHWLEIVKVVVRFHLETTV